MKVILEEKDLMSIVEAHVASNPFFNLKGKEVSVVLNVTDDGCVEVAVDISEGGAVATTPPVKRRRRSSAEVKAAEANKAEPIGSADTAADSGEKAEAEVEAKKPPFEPTVVSDPVEEDAPKPVASKSLFA